jgi:uncharacterized protein (DUF885 family)
VGRGRRIARFGVLLVLVAGAVFLIPTIWFKPWFIEHFYARVFIEYALDRPMILSQLRILESYGLDFHSDDLDDFSTESTLKTARQVERNLRILRSYDRRSQSPEQRLSTDILEWFLQTQAEGRPFLFHSYPLNQLDGIQSTLPDFMLNTHQVQSVEDARNYVTRLSRFAVAFDQTLESVRYRAERGMVPPRFVVEAVGREVEELIAAPPSEHVLYTEFEEKLAALDEIPESRRVDLLEAARRELEATVYPAYRRLGAYLSELEEVATDDDGVWKLPAGDGYYAWALRWHTTTGMTADEIHHIGLAEVARIHREMRLILEAEGYPTEDLAATLQKLNLEKRFRYPDTEEGRGRILSDYRAIIDEVEGWLPAYFGRVPRAAVAVEPIPAFKEAGSPVAYYNLPAVDGSRPGLFFVNLRNVDEVPRFRMRTLAFHEAIPGHHLQVALALELEGLPFFRRVVPFTAFIEGWALYAERLAAEEGLQPTAYDRLGQLIDEVFRAARLVVDTGIHARRWTREQAID